MADTTEYLLGKLVESVDGLRRDITEMRDDFDQEKSHAHESRRDVHQKIDTLTHRVASVENSVALAGQVSAQTRDRVGGLEATITNEIKPTVDEFKSIKTMGRGFIAAAGIAGGALVYVITQWGGHIIDFIQRAFPR